MGAVEAILAMYGEMRQFFSARKESSHYLASLATGAAFGNKLEQYCRKNAALLLFCTGFSPIMCLNMHRPPCRLLQASIASLEFMSPPTQGEQAQEKI